MKSIILIVSNRTNVDFNTEGRTKMNKVYGYARISRKTQSIERQIRNIKAEYPEAIIIQEAYTGTKIDRPEWTKLYKNLKEGDTVIFDSVSRMSRNETEGMQTYTELFNKGVELVFLKEHHIDTATYKKAMQNGIQLTGTTVDFILEGVNQYLQALAKEQISLAFAQAQKEVDDLHQRTSEGMATAKLNGKQIGGVTGKKLTTKKSVEKKAEIKKYLAKGNTDTEIIKLTGLARNTYYKYKKEINAEEQE